MRCQLIALACLALFVCGCGKPENDYVGSWIGEYDLSLEEWNEAFADLTPEQRAEVEAEMKGFSFDLTLNKDLTYVIEISTVEFTGVLTGRWRTTEDGNRLTLRSPNINQEMKEQASKIGMTAALFIDQDFVVADDRDTLTTKDLSGGVLTGLKFTRN